MKYHTNKTKGASILHADAYDDYEYDDYDAYGDFGLNLSHKGAGAGGSRGGGRAQKNNEKRGGGSQGSGTVYSAKHIRLREARRKEGQLQRQRQRNAK